MIKKIILVMTILMLSSLMVAAQITEKTVTLVVSGDGATKDEAVKQALRSAIEQTFGAFVSANTEVLNDELIRDEIVTISSGNITNYKEVNVVSNSDGSYSSTVEATVSIGGLTNFAKNKGMSVDIETGAFAMNMKIRELNKENEILAIKDLQTKLRKMGSEYNYFDYDLELSEPYIKGDYYAVKATINIKPNSNLAVFRNTILSTLKSLSLSEEEQAEYERANIPLTKIVVTEYGSDDELIKSMQQSNHIRKKSGVKYSIIALRNTDVDYPFLYFPILLLNNELKCSLEDNTGKYFGYMYTIDRSHGEHFSPHDIAHASSPVWPVHDFDSKYRNSNVEHYVYSLGCTIGAANLVKSRLFGLDENFDFSISDSMDPMGNPMSAGQAVLVYEMFFPKDHFTKINDITIKYRRPYYYENK